MTEERKQQLIKVIEQGTRMPKRWASIPDMLKPYCKKDRVFMINHIRELVEGKVLFYERTSAHFLQNPQTNVSWINCKEGSRNRNLFKTFFLFINGYYVSHICKRIDYIKQ